MTLYTDLLHDCEAALWLSDTPETARQTVRWTARLTSMVAYQIVVGLVGLLLVGGLVAATR